MAPEKRETGSTPVAGFPEEEKLAPPWWRGRDRISIPIGAGPDQLVAVLAFDL
jgi:hypothetical protein